MAPQRQRTTAAEKQELRAAYIQGEGSLRSLAEDYEIPVATVERWSAAEHWTALRRECELVQLGELCPSQAPRIPLPAPPPPDEADVMERRRITAMRVIEEQIQKLLERQNKTQHDDTWNDASKLLGEHAERLLRVCGLIPRPENKQSKRISPATSPPESSTAPANAPETNKGQVQGQLTAQQL